METWEVKPFVVSAPFGDWFRYRNATSTLGTFTAAYRGGMLYRIWRCLRTLRYDRRMGGWVNRLGLPNPGIRSVDLAAARERQDLVSIHGFSRSDWMDLAMCTFGCAVEYNLSCPNALEVSLFAPLDAIAMSLTSCPLVVAKLSPLGWQEWMRLLYPLGIRWFHLCNTLPTPSGGLSGPVLKALSLDAVRRAKDAYPDVKLIGGGGVRSQADVDEYRRAGACTVALASVLLNPFRWRGVRKLIDGEA